MSASQPITPGVIRQATGPAPALSIIMAVYNAGAYVEQALASVLGQPGPALEVVAIDDASTDDSLARLRRVADPRLTLLALPANTGPGRSRNAAVPLARAAWLCPFDADDVMLPGTLGSYFAEATARPGADWACCGMQLCDAQLQPQGVMVRHGFDLVEMLERDIVCHPMALFRRELFSAAGGYDEELPRGVDYSLFLRMLPWAEPWYYPKATWLYRRHGDNVTSRKPDTDAALHQRFRARVLDGPPLGDPARWQRLQAAVRFLAAVQAGDWPRALELGESLHGGGLESFELDKWCAVASERLGRPADALAGYGPWLDRLGAGVPLMPHQAFCALTEGLRLALVMGDAPRARQVRDLAPAWLARWPYPPLARLLAAGR